MISRTSLCIFFLGLSAAAGFTIARGGAAFQSNLKMSSSAPAEVMPEVKVGDKIPSVTMSEGLPDFQTENYDIAELIAGKKVVIAGVPGAFTPGCSKSHLPSFMDAADELKSKGIDMVIFMATNDPFVMGAWARESGGDKAGIKFLSDSSGDFTRKLGLVMETPTMLRTKRFTLIAEDGVVTEYFSSEKESSNTWAPSVMAKL